MSDKNNMITDNINDNDDTKIEVVKQPRISIVWLVPVIALIFGGWLAIKAISEQGQFISIEFKSGRGIIAKKTEIRYKGLVAGIVKSVEPSENLQHVIVEIEMSAKFSPYLTTETLFWLVTADVSLEGVSGLETLLSGNYINMQPDIKGEASTTSSFVALTNPPQLDLATPGLHLKLYSKVLGSISQNSPILFKQLPIGHVSGYRYVESSKKIEISVYIEPDYAHLVKENAQFWNSSGVQVVASLSAGIKINTGSLASIIAGGISVGNLSFQQAGLPAKNGQTFSLHPDFQAAEMGHEIELKLGWNSGVDKGAAILYQGVTIGVVESFSKIDPQDRQIIAKAKVNPRIIPYLTDSTQFYIVSPQISLAGISSAGSLIKGTYLSFRPSLIGERIDHFTVFNTKPAYQYTEPGLHLILTTNNRESLQAGSPIYFKQQAVGTVQAIDTIGADKHLVHIHIAPEFQHYVSVKSHFWNSSGIDISANLQGVKINVKSLQAVLTGGISFDLGSSEKETKIAPENGDEFQLYANENYAQQQVEFTLHVPNSMVVKDDTRILFRGKKIGAIHKLTDNGQSTVITAGILPEYRYILAEDTQFWLAKTQLSLSGMSDTEALLGGAYITFDIAKRDSSPKATKTVFPLLAMAPEKHASSTGLQLTLIAKHANVVSSGSPVSYRGITVGQVDNVQLHSEKDHIHINLTLDESQQHLVTAQSRFYNASGVTFSGSLNDFVVKTESADAVLRGGISFYNPDSLNREQVNLAVQEKDKFTLFDHIESAKGSGLAITVHFADASGLNELTKITYHQQGIGRVERLIFDENQVGVTALILLNDRGKRFAVAGSKFWLAQTEVGLVGSKNITSILDGGSIKVVWGQGEVKTAFIAQQVAPVIERLPYGLNLKLVTESKGSVRIGNPVLYRQIAVGKVIGVGLSDDASKVNVFINIANKYAPLVTAKSQFWNASGFNVAAGIFSGVDIESESMETLLSGGIAFATPEEDSSQKVSQDHRFMLNDNLDKDWLDWQPKISLNP